MTQGEHTSRTGLATTSWDALLPHDVETIGDEAAALLVLRLTRHGEPHD
jgi:hypothetical protein